MKRDKPLEILGPIDVQPLQRKLAGTPREMWERRTFRQNSTATQKDTESIILCWSGFASAKREEYRWDAFQTDKWTPEYEFFREEMDLINAHIKMHRPGGVLRSMLTRLKPGGHVSPHADIDPTFDHSHRLHLPIVTDYSVQFVVDGEGYLLQEGWLIEFDNLREHSVLNNGPLARVHLIVDVLSDGRG